MIAFFLILSILSALIWHWRVKAFWLAVAGSTLTSVLVTWALTSSHIGLLFLDFAHWELDSAFTRNISIIGVVSFVAALVVGVLFRVVKGGTPDSPSESNP